MARTEPLPDLASVNLDVLTEEERQELMALTELRFGGEGLRDFIRRVSPNEPPPRHLDPLIDAIERARREPIRLCISMPPRHAKTVTILKAIVWWLLRTPGDTCGYFSYNHDIARSKSRIARDIARRADLELTDPDETITLELSSEKKSLSEWRTSSGGGVLAGGVGGGLTGQGITGFVVVDDPFKNREDADSEVYRQKVWEWFNEVVMTRLERASAIVVHTRWHDDDLIGRLEDLGGWEIIRLPALAEEDDPLGRNPGEALWPERFPAEDFGTEPGQPGTVRGQIGEFSFAALYQQRPQPRGAKVYGPASYYDPVGFDLTGWQIFIGADPAGDKKTTSDWSVGIVLAVRELRRIRVGNVEHPELEGRVLDMYREQVTIPEFARALRALQLRWHLAPIYVEAVAGFKAVPQILRENDPALIVKEAPLLGDKFQRAQLASAAWNARPSRLLVPLGAPPWLAALLYELARFTGVGDAEDDIADALAHAWNAAVLSPKPPVFRKPTSSMPRRR